MTLVASDDPLFQRAYDGTRLAETRRGDTLQAVAARELGDPTRWAELVFLNNLRPPYLTDDIHAAGDGVLLTGASLTVPASADFVPAGIDPATVFGTDILLSDRLLSADATGDIAVVSGNPNLVQAIRHVIATDIGELLWHPAYGCGARALIGQRGTPTAVALADALVRRAVNGDDRISSVTASTTTLAGDTLRSEMTAEAINGVTVHVSN